MIRKNFDFYMVEFYVKVFDKFDVLFYCVYENFEEICIYDDYGEFVVVNLDFFRE